VARRRFPGGRGSARLDGRCLDGDISFADGYRLTHQNPQHLPFNKRLAALDWIPPPLRSLLKHIAHGLDKRKLG
jgi:hypothetical protein